MTIAQIIKPVMSSSAEAELAALFIICREAVPARHALEEMGHKQPPTPVQTDNTTAHGVVTNNIARKRLKSMDIRLHWLRCRATQGRFCHFWKPGATNIGDYPSKDHAAIHHRTIRPTFLTSKYQLDLLRKRAHRIKTLLCKKMSITPLLQVYLAVRRFERVKNILHNQVAIL